MKNLLLIISLIISVNLSASELEWVDQQIQAIKPPRDGISKAKINSVEDPFVFLNKVKKAKATKKNTNTMQKRKSSKRIVSFKNGAKISTKTTSFFLDAIINKSALINGKWYKLNAKVGKYTLSSVDKMSVILSYKGRQLLLSTATHNKKLKFKNN